MEKLVTKAQKGDKQAFVMLVEQNKRALTRMAMTVLSNEEDVADAVAETVLCMVQKLHTLRQPKYFKTWMTKILLNNCYMILRGQKREVPVAYVPEDGYEQHVELEIDVRDTLAELSENDKLVLTLYYMDDLSIKDIAKLLDVNENTIKARIRRGKKRFISAYEKREDAIYETY